MDYRDLCISEKVMCKICTLLSSICSEKEPVLFLHLKLSFCSKSLIFNEFRYLEVAICDIKIVRRPKSQLVTLKPFGGHSP